MTITSFSSGVNTSFSSELNSNFSSAYTLQGLNHIRQLIDRNGVYSKGFIDGWGEAYIDINGRNDSVDTTWSITQSIFDTDKYSPGNADNRAPGDTTHDPDSVTNPSNCFDENPTTYAIKTYSGYAGGDTHLGKLLV